MTDTPDFDKMSPEEIMLWMESLAKRQGASEGFTTAADMAVQEVAADDPRAANVGEYIPFEYRNKPDEWRKRVEEEDRKKREKAAQQPAAVPPPAPAPAPQPVAAAPVPAPQPEPVAAAAPAADETPDFDKMSPDEIMRWMESLAKRQGASEGFTTAADMNVKEVAADDPRAANVGEYIPFEWRNKPDEWRKKVEEEERKKREKAAQQQQQPPAAVQPPAPQPVSPPPAPVQPAASLDDVFAALPTFDDEEDETVPAATSNPMDWLSELTGEPDNALASVMSTQELEDPLAALENLAAGTTDNSMDWLAGLADTGDSLDALAGLADMNTFADAPADPLATLNNLIEPAPTTSSSPNDAINPIEWMETLARDQGANPEELTTPANLNIQRPQGFTPDGPGYTPYSFESGGDSSSDEALTMPSNDLSWLNTDDDEEIEGLDLGNPEDWLDNLATSTGSDPRSVEAPVAETNVEDVMSRLNRAEDVTPEDIEGMFDALFKKAEQFADRDETLKPEPEPEPEEEPLGAIQAEIPDWLAEQMTQTQPDEEAIGDDSMAELLDSFGDEDEEVAEPAEMPDWMNTVTVVEADEDAGVPDFLAQGADDGGMPDWLQGGADEDVPAVDAGMPDWLTEGVSVDEAPVLDVAGEAEPANIPEWLLAGTDEEDTGAIEEIFAPDEAAATVAAAKTGDVQVDMSDPWVAALTQETENEESLASWYKQQTGSTTQTSVQEAVNAAATQPIAAAPTGSLQTADLPLETDLPAGEPEPVPDWLLGEVAAEPAISVSEIDDADMPSWLMEPAAVVDDGMPDWLRDTVDDSVAEGATDLPDWMNDPSVNAEEIPDWLRETMDKEEEAPAIPVFAPTAPAVQQPAALATRPQHASPVPVPAHVNIDVAATLQAARSKVSSGDIDGSLAEYEAIVRANSRLDEVVSDLSRLADDKNNKKNPALYRVLGDGLMRRGNLKQALETYRRALNML